MPDIVLPDYPGQKKRDLRAAMAETLANYIAGMVFGPPYAAIEFQLAKVYYEWAVFEKNALTGDGLLPAAAVLPDEAQDEDSQLAPKLLEDTWETNGIDGLGLYKISEKVVPMMVVIRAQSKPERQAILSTIEDSFIRAGGNDREQPVAYGIHLEMPSYYNRKARYTLLRHRLLDQATNTSASRYLVQVEFLVQASHVVLRRVPAMDVRITAVVDDVDASRDSQDVS